MLGIKLGANLSKFSSEVGDYSSSNPYYSWKNCFREGGPVIGGMMNFKLSKIASIQAEMLYNSKGGRSKKESNEVQYETTNTYYGTTTTSSAYNYKVYRVNYIEVPLLANIDLTHGNGFCLQAGIAPSFAISSKLRENAYILNTNDESAKEKWHVSDFPYANRFNASLILGAAALSDSWYLDLRYTKTLRDTYSIEKLDDVWNMKATMTTFSFSIGVFF